MRPYRLRKLNRKRPHASTRSVDDDDLTLLQLKGVLDTLQRGQSRSGYRSRMFEIQHLRCVRYLICRHSNVLSIEAALGIEPTVRVHAIPDFEAANPRTHSRHS